MKNSHYLQTIYENTRSLGLVTSQYGFGRLCGRKDSWFSSAKSSDRPMTISAMITLAMNIERLPADQIPRSKRKQVKELTQTLWLLVESKTTYPTEWAAFTAARPASRPRPRLRDLAYSYHPRNCASADRVVNQILGWLWLIFRLLLVHSEHVVMGK